MLSEEQIKYLKGKRVHFKGFKGGCNWIFRRMEGENAICITPKTRRDFIGKIDDMYPSAKVAGEYFNSLK